MESWVALLAKSLHPDITATCKTICRYINKSYPKTKSQTLRAKYHAQKFTNCVSVYTSVPTASLSKSFGLIKLWPLVIKYVFEFLRDLFGLI